MAIEIWASFGIWWDLVGCIPNLIWLCDIVRVSENEGYPTNEFFGYLIFRHNQHQPNLPTPFQVPSQLMGEKWWKLIFLDTNFCSKPPAGYTVCGIATDCIFHSTTEDLYPVLESCLQLRPFDVQLRHGELVLPRRTDFHRFPQQESLFFACFCTRRQFRGFDSQGFMTWTEYCYTKTSGLQAIWFWHVSAKCDVFFVFPVAVKKRVSEVSCSTSIHSSRFPACLWQCFCCANWVTNLHACSNHQPHVVDIGTHWVLWGSCWVQVHPSL